MLYFSGSHIICPKKAIMFLHTWYATFRCLCHILCSDFGVKYICSQEAIVLLLLYCCMVVSGLFTLVFVVVTSYF